MKEVQEKHELKDEFGKFKVESRARVLKLVESIVRLVVDDTWQRINDEYILYPKPKDSLLASLLARRKTLLGKSSSYP